MDLLIQLIKKNLLIAQITFLFFSEKKKIEILILKNHIFYQYLNNFCISFKLILLTRV